MCWDASRTSIERLGRFRTNLTGTATGAAADWSAELIRIDGEHAVTHVLTRRTRIGRASGCELQIESGLASRHHALIVVGPREAIIEDPQQHQRGDRERTGKVRRQAARRWRRRDHR